MTENQWLKIFGILVIFLAIEIFRNLIGAGVDNTDRRILFGALSAVRQVITLNLVVFLFLRFSCRIWKPAKTMAVTARYWFLPWAAIVAAGTMVIWISRKFLLDHFTIGGIVMVFVMVIYILSMFIPLIGLLRGIEKNFQLQWKNKEPLILAVTIVVVQLLAAEGMSMFLK